MGALWIDNYHKLKKTQKYKYYNAVGQANLGLHY